MMLKSESLRLVPLLYITYVIYEEKVWRTAETGGRRWKFVRSWRIWKHFCNYFPIKIIKTAELDKDKNYLTGCHPHGVFAIGAFGAFGCDGLEWGKLFPGISRRVCTLAAPFWLPGFREVVHGSGACKTSKSSIEYLLRTPKSGVTALVVGGAQEALEHDSKSVPIVLRHRKGFVKLALKCGANLLPSFSFGEQLIYNYPKNPTGSLLRRFQEGAKSLLSFSPVIFFGRGIFQYSFGILPHRRPINVVIGSPIPVEKAIECPTDAQVNELHQKYMKALEKLYYDYNDKYGNANMKLLMK